MFHHAATRFILILDLPAVLDDFKVKRAIIPFDRTDRPNQTMIPNKSKWALGRRLRPPHVATRFCPILDSVDTQHPGAVVLADRKVTEAFHNTI
jgi:hypothetical protein